MQVTRRSALSLPGLLLTSACWHEPSARAPRADPDAALRMAALDRERALLALYADAIAASPSLSARLTPLLADHESHLAALGGMTVVATSRPPAVMPPAAVLARVAAAERAAAAGHAAAALTASRQLAATLASLAACESSHVVVL